MLSERKRTTARVCSWALALMVAVAATSAIAQDAPLLAASDYQGQTFDVFRSKGQMAAVAATGATPTDVSFGDVEYTSAERNLRPYIDNYVTKFRYVTANVNLWPQTLALIANPDSLSRLTSEQRGWVQQAFAQRPGVWYLPSARRWMSVRSPSRRKTDTAGWRIPRR